MKGWIKFGPKDNVPEHGRSWHQAVEIRVLTACTLEAATDERPGWLIAYGARICPTCAAAKERTRG